ncbi:MAG: preprotein translocase subunit SecA [Clostridia bacterium]|nr:preprotein translocase subunit SecA [Clostridia bacterium]
MSFLRRLFGNTNDAELKRLNKTVAEINALEPSIKKLSDAQLRAQTEKLKNEVKNGKTLDDILPEAFATCREAMWRTLGKRHFDVQLIGGIVLHQGRIAEMRTGEGKTYTAALAAYLNALSGGSVHVVTVNDYLARFQGEEIGKVYRFLGLTCGIITHDMEPMSHKEQYACDIVYGTNNEFGFDYLRDNMVVYEKNMVQRSLDFAIVDEVDSILIDEARTPLIISGQGEKSTELYTGADRFISTLKPADFEIDEKQKTVVLLETGVKKAEGFFGVENLSDIENTELTHHINQALRAHAIMKRDIDYVVKDGQIIIVDEFTGRLMTGRRYSDGLHQAIEAKERVSVQRESKTLATITFQNYFRMYKKLSGMTGTAKTEEDEFQSIYSLDVVTIPTNKPMIREDLPDRIYKTVEGKYRAVVRDIVEKHKTGQPVLVGTVSVEKSELLSRLLSREGVSHTVLNAKFHEKEAEIIAQAGKVGSVTIATNMAGRGTDILLGGNPEFMARKKMRQDGFEDGMIDAAQSFNEDVEDEVKQAREVYRDLVKQFSVETQREHDEVVKKGGLYIIGTERHESRRIDNQLRGRAGRQGDPGLSCFYLSLQDDLLRLFGSDRMEGIVSRLGMGEDDVIDAKMLSKQIENAQKHVEGRNFDTRKRVLEYDNVMNTQREIIYGQRREVLAGKDIHASIMDMLDKLIEHMVGSYCPDGVPAEEWELGKLNAELTKYFLEEDHFHFTEKEFLRLKKDTIIDDLKKIAYEKYAVREKEAEDCSISMREVERVVLLRVVDDKWMTHIDNMDQLRQGIGLRSVGQKNPVQEYQFEGFDMFEAMVESIRETTLRMLFAMSFRKPVERKQVATPTAVSGGGAPEVKKPAAASKKPGRNDPCPCGSGKKYKNCCGRNE